MAPICFAGRLPKAVHASATLLLLLFLFATTGITEARGGHGSRSEDEKPVVCAQTVFAIDGSGSTGPDAFHRQITALVAAFRNSRLYRAIEECLPGSLAFAAMTWSGPAQQRPCIGWTVVTDGADGLRAVEAFRSCRYIGGTTDIGRAIGFALRLLADSPFDSYYRTVFLLTNGRTDRGSEAALLEARAVATHAGVTVSGYALLAASPKGLAPFFVPDAVPLGKYVAEQVVAGPRAFSASSQPEDDHQSLLRALVEMLRQELN